MNEKGKHVVPEALLARPSPRSHELSKTHRSQTPREFDHIVLLLQGGGALGAYQAGVYERWPRRTSIPIGSLESRLDRSTAQSLPGTLRTSVSQN
jgi:predicted acylesterase/phospholipase RssA